MKDQVLRYQELDPTVKIATEEQKNAARQAFMEQRKGSEASKMKRLIYEEAELEPDHVAFNGVVTMPYFPDNGTKHNVIPRKVVTEVLRVCPGVEKQRLQNPVTGKAVEGAIIRCDEYIKLD
ncbi:hypothetical protein PHMEG_00017313 [Phytophthora megakarya]|uniref:Uncharacterized protein n=1 Tax=Phytophthora megakarya TaxID=4795 RepID=A0A225VY76_9STRA|nr:hypothetical protein PHMEG_00017313 [Phytophthora megakarya]